MCALLTHIAVPLCCLLSGLQASPAPTVSLRGPYSSCSSPLKGHCLVKPSQSPLPFTTMDRHGPAAHTVKAVIFAHRQPSVHPAQGAGVCEEQNAPRELSQTAESRAAPRARDPVGWVRWYQRTPCLRNSPRVQGTSAVEKQEARSLAHTSWHAEHLSQRGQGKMP